MKTLNKKADAELVKLLVIALSLFIIFTIANPAFAKKGNISSMMFQLPELGFYTLAVMMAILSGGRDLSVVSIGNLSGILACKVMHIAVEKGYTGGKEAVFIFLGIGVALSVGLLIGTLNGLSVSKLGIPPFLGTLAVADIVLGIATIITKGKAVTGTPDAYNSLGNMKLIGIPYTTWFLIIAIIFTAFILKRSRYGFEVRMVGSNPKAAKFSGINTTKVYLKAYIFSGIISSICGLTILMRTDTAKSDYAITYSMVAILSSVLGGTDPNGGKVKVWCIIVALLSLQFLSSGFNILHLSSFWKEFTWGLLLILTMAYNSIAIMIKQKKGQKKAE